MCCVEQTRMRLKGIPQGYKKAYRWNTCHEFVMYTYDMIKYMLWLAAFMCVFKTKKRKNATTTARRTMDEPVWAQGWSPEDLPSDEPDADPHGVTPSAKQATQRVACPTRVSATSFVGLVRVRLDVGLPFHAKNGFHLIVQVLLH